MKGYVFIGESDEDWTNGKVYYLKPDHSLDCSHAFIDDQGEDNGFYPKNDLFFKPIDEMKNQSYINYKVTFETITEDNSENVIKLYSVKENESLEERISKEIKDNQTLILRQVIRI